MAVASSAADSTEDLSGDIPTASTMDGSAATTTTTTISGHDAVAAATMTTATGAAKHPSPPSDSFFRVGLVIHGYSAQDAAISGIGNPVSGCRVTALVVLNSDRDGSEGGGSAHGDGDDDVGDDGDGDAAAAELGRVRDDKTKKWLENNKIQNIDEVDCLYGDEGFEELLRDGRSKGDGGGAAPATTNGDGSTPSKNACVHAVYIFVPTEYQNKYVLRSLECGKHVLLKDPVSTSLQDFVKQQNHARKYSRFIQFSTMFVHHHSVKTFFDCVLYGDFGRIESINATLNVHVDDTPKVGVKFPLEPGDGCVFRLGRYCVLLSALLLTRAGSRPVSAQVKRHDVSSTGEPMSADCVVRFTNSQVLTFHVAYTHAAATRQVLEVRASDRYATMTDFVIPHPDGLSTYRVYDKAKNSVTGKLDVVRGEAIDVPSGPPQDVMMWRRFRELSRSVDKGWDSGKNPMVSQARELANVALQTKCILRALEDSMDSNYSLVPVNEEGSVF